MSDYQSMQFHTNHQPINAKNYSDYFPLKYNLYFSAGRDQAVGGAVAMLWNAAAMLPLKGSDGKAAIATIVNTLPVAGFANFLAFAFVVRQTDHGVIYIRISPVEHKCRN